MNLTSFLAMLESISALLPGVGKLVQAAHPNSDESVKINTAIVTINAGLATTGAIAEQIAAIAPIVHAVANGTVVTAPATPVQ
jgi:hypothetical protein